MLAHDNFDLSIEGLNCFLRIPKGIESKFIGIEK
jgi:hypothetical protein